MCLIVESFLSFGKNKLRKVSFAGFNCKGTERPLESPTKNTDYLFI